MDYDTWRLRGPHHYAEDFGEYEGDECGRWIEPDEDYPKPRRCIGTMTTEAGSTACDLCGAEGYSND